MVIPSKNLLNHDYPIGNSAQSAKTKNPKRLIIKHFGFLQVVPLDYLLVLFLNEPWKKFNAVGSSGITTFSGTPIYGSFEY